MKKISFLLFIIIAAEFFTFVACEKKIQPVSPSQSKKEQNTTWYQLIEGKFEKISETSPAIAIKGKPWTVQQSITDTLIKGNTCFMGINGYGIASVTFKDNSTYPLFRYYYDPIIFKYRTLTTLLPFKDSIICHIYFNQTLNETSPESLKIQGISLVRLIPKYENYKFIIVPFQRANPDWESVTFLPLSDTKFLFEWKHTSKTETKFKYTSLNLTTLEERSISRSDFLSSYNITQISDCEDKSLRKLLYFVKNKLKNPSIIHFHLRTPLSHVDRIYIYTPTKENKKTFNLVSLTLIKTPDFYYVLVPDSKYFKTGPSVYRIRTGTSTIREIELPTVPPGYTYNSFNVMNNRLILGWEQNSFTNVKCSGLLILKY